MKKPDRSRRFVLPGIQDLNKDQDEALALPLQGQHLIIGGPGTGKSVVALLRARRLAQDRRTYRTLVYNRLLEHSNSHLFGKQQGESFRSDTWDGWFRKLYKHFFQTVPVLPAARPGGYQSLDWQTIERTVQTLKDSGDHSGRFLVIDEGQDMPPAFYQSLVNLGFENFYVVADQNQQLEPERCSSRRDLENTFGIATEDTLELKTNYRNTLPIALLARHFYPDDPASPRPELPASSAGALRPELWRYGSSGEPAASEIIARILQLSDRFPSKLIGILTPDNKTREGFLGLLNTAAVQLDHGRPPIQTYPPLRNSRRSLNFASGGIMVINAHSCKGLEFDICILADVDKHLPKRDLYSLKSKFYVMVTRAREQVIFLRSGNPCPVVDSLLPSDPEILARKE